MPTNQSKEDKGLSDLKIHHLKTPQVFDTLKNKIFFVGQNSLTGAKGLSDKAGHDSDD
jgi:hypothetical protein